MPLLRPFAVVLALAASCSRRDPTPPALPEPEPTASAPTPPPADAPLPTAAPSAPTPTPDPAPDPDPDPDPSTVTVPPLDADTTAALATFVALQASIAGEPPIEIDVPFHHDVQITQKARRVLPAVKRASREAARRVIGAALAAGERSPKVLAIQVQKAFEAAGAKTDHDRFQTGSLVDVGVERPAGHPTKLGLVVTLSIPCGADGSLYVLEEQPRGAPSVLMAVEANGWLSVQDAQLGTEHAISPPDDRGGWLAVVASSRTWCSSTWRGIDYRVLAPGPTPETPRQLLRERDSAQIGDRIGTVTAGRDDLTVWYRSWASFQGEPSRPYVHRYARRGAGFERVQPIVTRAVDLPEEWGAMPWEEARRFVAGVEAGSLLIWHDRLRRAAKELHGRVAVESEDAATGRTRLALTCDKCAELPARVLVDVVKDGEGWAMEGVREAP